MASTPRLQVGTIFAGDYRIVGPLAEGGMGSVYRAEQLSTHKPRAVKVVHGRLLDDERSRARFVREATIAASIASEHVVEVIAAGIDHTTELPYLVMELLDGGDLAAVVRHRGRLTATELGALLRQLCHGLAAAHAARVIHRDLKPENIFVAHPLHAGTSFTVKILDFGIAKVTQESKSVATLTGTIGSPLWMSPEQINNEALGTQTDVWALGLLAFWALTGQSYWRTARAERLTVQALFAEQLFRALDPASTRATEFAMGECIPPGFDDWFVHCVTRSPDDRFADAGAAWAAFEQAVDPGLRPGITLLPPRGEVWDSTSSRMAAIGESTLADRGASDSAGLLDTGVGTTFGGPPTIANTHIEVPQPADVASARSGVDVGEVPAPPRRRIPVYLLGSIAAACVVGVGWLALRPAEDDDDGELVGSTDVANDPPAATGAEMPGPPLETPESGGDDGAAPIGPRIEDGGGLPPSAAIPPADEAAAIELVRPMITQPSFSSAALQFVGWSDDGSRFVLDSTYPDREGSGPADRLRLLQVHDALSGAMIESFLVEREADPTISKGDRLARAAAEAEPYGEWGPVRAALAVGHADPSSRAPTGVAHVELSVGPTPAGGEITTETTAQGFAFRWTVGPSAAGTKPVTPRIHLQWISGAQRWELLDVPLATDASGLWALRSDGQRPTYAGTVALHWSPQAHRVVAIIRAEAEPGEPAVPTATTRDMRWFLRASGPQIRLVDAGAGQRKLRAAAWSLQTAGLPIAAADLDHQIVDTSRTYVRARDPNAAVVAATINEALGTTLPSALLDRSGWTQLVVVLGRDFGE